MREKKNSGERSHAPAKVALAEPDSATRLPSTRRRSGDANEPDDLPDTALIVVTCSSFRTISKRIADGGHCSLCFAETKQERRAPKWCGLLLNMGSKFKGAFGDGWFFPDVETNLGNPNPHAPCEQMFQNDSVLGLWTSRDKTISLMSPSQLIVAMLA